MKPTRCIFSLALLITCNLAWSVFAQDSAFTYQGRLNTGATQANGEYEMTFDLYDAATNGNVVGSQSVAPVPVTNGLFMVSLDFGSNAFNGAPRWLEITVNLFGSDQIPTTLAPRQRITSAPYAIHAGNAAGLMTSANVPLDITVGGRRALRIEPTIAAANIIGGYAQNGVSNGVVGAFIGGGGLNDFSEGNYPNRVNASYSAIVGGYGNTVSDESAFIGGRGTVRAMEAQRYAGDASLYGTSELRIPVAKLRVILPLDVGVLGFVEAGRVYVDGDSPGGWHSAAGGGLWFGIIDPGTGFSVTLTNAAEKRLVLGTGLKF